MESIPKFVINLKRRPDRLKQFIERCPLKDVKVVNAFDGHNITGESESSLSLYKKLTCSLPGERGVFVSHLRIFQEVIDKNYESALIFEDDAEFSSDFLNIYNKVLKEIPGDMDILYIGGRFSPNFIMEEYTCKKITPNIVKHNLDIEWNGYSMDRTMHAYIISNKGAKKLIEEFNSLNTMDVPVDHWAIRLFTKEKMAIYNSSPLLCHSPMVGDSDIRGFKNTFRHSNLRG